LLVFEYLTEIFGKGPLATKEVFELADLGNLVEIINGDEIPPYLP
jgi:hypothetical protein